MSKKRSDKASKILEKKFARVYCRKMKLLEKIRRVVHHHYPNFQKVLSE